MKNVIVVMALCLSLLFAGCASNTSTIGDGKIDPVEIAMLNVAVGLAMQSRPDCIKPAYDVSTVLLVVLAGDLKQVTVVMLEEILNKEVAKLNMDPLTKQSFLDLVALIKIEISNNIGSPTASETTKLVVTRDVLKVVQTAAGVRLGLLK